jgi:hypothetical protein
VEGVLGSARPPRTLPNLAGRRDEHQGRESRAKEGLCCVFDDWKLESSIGRDHLVYIEGLVLSQEEKSKMHSPSSHVKKCKTDLET